MRTCPKCGQPVRDEYTLCPFCGTDVATGERTENARGSDNDGSGFAGGALGCTFSGIIYYFCGAVYLISGNMLFTAGADHAANLGRRDDAFGIGFLLPIALTGLLYLLLRRRFPAFARGLGFSCLFATAVALGAPFLCNSQSR